MINLKITQEQINYATQLVEKSNFGNRGKFDGDKSKQLVGMLAQVVVADYIRQPRPEPSTGFDGGYDYIINGKKVDVKCMARKSDMFGDYVHNLVGYQKNYDVDYYLFTNLNTRTNTLQICGVITKQDFFKHAKYFPIGASRYSGRKQMIVKAPLYELVQYRLHMLGNVMNDCDIYRKIS